MLVAKAQKVRKMRMIGLKIIGLRCGLDGQITSTLTTYGRVVNDPEWEGWDVGGACLDQSLNGNL